MVLIKNVAARNRSVTTKIAIQISTKIGGAPWGVNIPMKVCEFTLQLFRNICIVGYCIEISISSLL